MQARSYGEKVKRTAAVIGTAVILFALGFSLVHDSGRDIESPNGAPIYSTTYMVTAWEIRPKDPPSPLDGSDLPVTGPR
jgi:hypothetical protein